MERCWGQQRTCPSVLPLVGPRGAEPGARGDIAGACWGRAGALRAARTRFASPGGPLCHLGPPPRQRAGWCGWPRGCPGVLREQGGVEALGFLEQNPLFRGWGKAFCHPPHLPKDPVARRWQRLVGVGVSRGSAKPFSHPQPHPTLVPTHGQTPLLAVPPSQLSPLSLSLPLPGCANLGRAGAVRQGPQAQAHHAGLHPG